MSPHYHVHFGKEIRWTSNRACCSLVRKHNPFIIIQTSAIVVIWYSVPQFAQYKRYSLFTLNVKFQKKQLTLLIQLIHICFVPNTFVTCVIILTCHYSDICVVNLIRVVIVTGEHQVRVVGGGHVSCGAGEAGRVFAAPADRPAPGETAWVHWRGQSVRSSGRTAEVNAIDVPCFMVIFAFCRQDVWS